MSTQPFTWKPETILKADFKKHFEPTAYVGIAATLALESGPIIIHAPDASQLAHAYRHITGHEINTSKPRSSILRISCLRPSRWNTTPYC